MNVLLTHAYFLEDDAKEQQIMRPYPPLGILYISAWLEKAGITNDVFDTTFASKREQQQQLRETRPEIVGVYVNLMTKPNVLELIQFVKNELPDTTIILGGPEVRASAERFLRHGADFIVVGEGEETMADLCSLSATDRLQKKAEHIPGIAFLKEDRYIETPERTKIKDLDELPVPNRHKINLLQYLEAWRNKHGKNAISISTMRGCPYTCKWCSRAVYGLSYRRRSPGKVVDELVNVIERYHPDTFWFVDDVFTISHKWLAGFRDELRKRNVSISYECISRADRMNDDVIHMLKDTGCFRVWIGAESGSQKVIDLMDRRVDVQQVRDMIRATQQQGIEAGTFIMLGYPGETQGDIEETIHHLKESNPDHFTITVAYPIRGTELYQEVEALQTITTDWSVTTDRQLDFQRTYRRRYYDFAVRRVVNEVHTHKAWQRREYFKSAKLKTKAMLAQAAMTWFRLLPNHG